MEDVTLSRRVATAGWELANVRHAQIFHHSQSAADKQDIAAMAFMEFRNRRYVMTEILNRRTFSDYLRLGLWECFTIVSGLTNAGGFRNFPKVLTGKLRALSASGSLVKRFRT
jgi:GT2 family glycosyltransferase